MKFAATGDALITRRTTGWGGEEYANLLSAIRGADARFTNLETLFCNGQGYPDPTWFGTFLTSPAECLTDLVGMGFNLFSRANNHAGDWGPEGVLETSRVCDAAGVCHAGAGRHLAEARLPAYLDLAAGKVALIAVSSAAPNDAFRAGVRRPDSAGRPGASIIRFDEYAIVPPDAMRQLRQLLAQSKPEKAKAHSVEMGFKGADPAGVLTVGGVRFREGDAYGESWEWNKTDVEDVLRQVRDARRQADVVLVSFHGHEMPMADQDSVPAFHRDFCYACIDAGCDAVMGHGPHRLRGIEVYKTKPIFYSLGNFIFQNEEAEHLPAEFYERLGLDPLAATPADGFDRRNSRGKGGFANDRAYWESALAVWDMGDGRLRQITLHPLDLGFGRSRAQRGKPGIARPSQAQEIIARLDGLSAPMGTHVTWDPKGYGVVKW